MKNVYKVTGLIVLIAIAGLLCAACNLFGGSIPVKVRAYDNKGSAPANLSMARASVQEGGGPRLAVTDTASFEPLKAYHDLLGEPKETFTPTSFELAFTLWAILSDGTVTTINEPGVYDFTKGLTIDVGDVPPDTTVSGLYLEFSDFQLDGKDYLSSVSFENDGNTITKSWHELSVVPSKAPTKVPTPAPHEEGVVYWALNDVVYYGDTRMFLPDTRKDEVPGIKNGFVAVGTFTPLPYLVVPFEEKVISSGSSAVTLHISWDLTDIIGDFTGPPQNPEGGEQEDPYRYHLTRGWWDNLYVYASVE